MIIWGLTSQFWQPQVFSTRGITLISTIEDCWWVCETFNVDDKAQGPRSTLTVVDDVVRCPFRPMRPLYESMWVVSLCLDNCLLENELVKLSISTNCFHYNQGTEQITAMLLIYYSCVIAHFKYSIILIVVHKVQSVLWLLPMPHSDSSV